MQFENDFNISDMTVGDVYDVQDKHGQWYAGECIERNGEKVKIHFLGWKSRYDDWINVSSEQKRFAPLMTFVKRTKLLEQRLALRKRETLDCKLIRPRLPKSVPPLLQPNHKTLHTFIDAQPLGACFFVTFFLKHIYFQLVIIL